MKSLKLSDSLEIAIRDSSLQDTIGALAEIGLDEAINEGLIREIPIIGTLVGMTRGVLSVRDRMFLKKIASLLQEIDSVPASVRQKMVDAINASAAYNLKVGEKLLYIVDKCEDHEASAQVGRLFKSFLDGRISYADFLRLARAIDQLHSTDLKEFMNSDWDDLSPEEGSIYLGTCLVSVDPLEIRVEDETDHDMGSPYRVENGTLKISVTRLGWVLRAVLSTNDIPPTPPKRSFSGFPWNESPS